MGLMAWFNERKQTRMARESEQRRIDEARLEEEARADREAKEKALRDAEFKASCDMADRLLERAVTALNEKRHEETVQLVDKCFEDHARYANGRVVFREKARYVKALALFAMERDREAADAFKELLQSEYSLECLMRLGMALTRIGEYREAEKFFGQLQRNLMPGTPIPSEVAWHLLLCRHNGDRTAAEKERFGAQG